jgi:hypothetical protein
MSKYISPLLLLVALVILALLTFMAVMAGNAHAGRVHYCGGPFDMSCAELDYRMKLKRQARARARANARAERRRSRRHRHRGTRVLGFHKTIEDEADPVTCRSYIAVVGSQYVTKNGAEDSAIKAWQEQVRYEHGERFMAWESASKQQVRCVRSSVGELGSKALDMTVKFYRCEVKGKPCMPPFESGK